jgi:hypothetical protein
MGHFMRASAIQKRFHVFSIQGRRIDNPILVKKCPPRNAPHVLPLDLGKLKISIENLLGRFVGFEDLGFEAGNQFFGQHRVILRL